MKWMLALCLCVGMGCQTTQSASMDPLPRWEYKVLDLDKRTPAAWSLAYSALPSDAQRMTLWLNHMTEKGWEFVQVVSGHFGMFRRQKGAEPPRDREPHTQ